MFSILLLFSSVHSFISKFSCSVSSFSFFIVSIVLHSLTLPLFYLLQFLSNLTQYFLSYFLSDHPNNFLTVNLPSSSFLLKIPSSLSYFLISSISLLYSFSNSSIAFFAFSRFPFSFQVSDSTVNLFHHTKYLSFPLIHHLFNILSTSYFSSPLIMTGAGCSFLYSSTCPMYLCILLTSTTGCILIVLGNSNSTVFANMIFFTL